MNTNNQPPGDINDCKHCKAQKDADDLAARLATALAEMDGIGEESLFQLQWTGGSAPEPIGDVWNIDYLPKGEKLAEIVELHYSDLKQQLYTYKQDVQILERKIVQAEQQRDDFAKSISSWRSTAYQLKVQRDELSERNADLLAALEEVRSDVIMVRDGRFVDLRTVVEELDAAIGKTNAGAT